MFCSSDEDEESRLTPDVFLPESIEVSGCWKLKMPEGCLDVLLVVLDWFRMSPRARLRGWGKKFFELRPVLTSRVLD